eukprot:CAMPEP_0119010542 /NCGR_PEP_ID=MMETSP1176-20130426/5081_1 /TAXON_ID=265551 /ORGANISM="Synedropsis recta cf, Strain CCMP1620" /LENGTH=592 /DNA_ID=CAMNT_0006963217 /DNA_START=491 /DNA_END=2269 /DNA_ORIENTATION=+
MIRKMREDKEKKKMPMANADESAFEAPGLRVGKEAWKWPPVWPYDDSTFTATQDFADAGGPDLGSMAGMMSGGMPPPPAAVVEEADKLDALQYWGEEKAAVSTELDADAASNLRNHYSFYLKDGMSVLEFGAASTSYLPDDLKLSRHVGIGASQASMDNNKELTDSYVVDLNKVETERGVDSEELRKLGTEPFDVVIMANTIDFLTNPREVYKSAWAMLKPGGTMLVAFSNKDAYNNKFESAQTKMWRDYNDDQHMWCVGSFFHFSAGDGWDNLRGFDLSPDDAKDVDDQGGPFAFLQGGKNNNMYVVMADKALQDDTIDPEDPEKSFKSRMWMLPTMESRDKILVAPRLKRAFEQIPQPDYLGQQVEFLPAVYESLIKMDQFSFTFSMQAQLAVDLVSDPDFNANDDQVAAMKQGLGLRVPREEFWAPVGQLTSAMEPDDKVNLLAHVVPRFGSGDPEQEAALQAFVTGLKPTFDHIRKECPSMKESDVQLLGSELLACEVLKPKRSSRVEFAKWLGALKESELVEILEARKERKEKALSALKQMRDIREEKERKEKEDDDAMQAQVATARKERTLEFDPRTGKYEVSKKK